MYHPGHASPDAAPCPLPPSGPSGGKTSRPFTRPPPKEGVDYHGLGATPGWPQHGCRTWLRKWSCWMTWLDRGVDGPARGVRPPLPPPVITWPLCQRQTFVGHGKGQAGRARILYCLSSICWTNHRLTPTSIKNLFSEVRLAAICCSFKFY